MEWLLNFQEYYHLVVMIDEHKEVARHLFNKHYTLTALKPTSLTIPTACHLLHVEMDMQLMKDMGHIVKGLLVSPLALSYMGI